MINRAVLTGVLLFALSVSSVHAAGEADLFLQAERNGWQAQKAFRHSMKFVHGWLGHRDPKSGLIPRNLTNSPYWNAQDSAADNYPFMVLTCALLDRQMFRATMFEMLQNEIRLTNRLDNLPDDFLFATQKFRTEEYNLDSLIFGGSEYVKDGLIPLTEWLGPTHWSGRMIGILDSIWKYAPIDTPYGKIPSTNGEVNGEQLQVLSRLYWMTGDPRYREWAFRLADYYLFDHPPIDNDRLSLDDHGCEIIGGLAGAYFLASHTDPERKEKYREPIYRMLDCILEKGRNGDGLFHMYINPKTGEIFRDELTDNWGYDYNAVLNVGMLDGKQEYIGAVRHVLSHVIAYVKYPWEGDIADGYADAIEGGLNLLNRIPDEKGFEWVDLSTDHMLDKQREDGVIEGWHGDGNYTRTALMYALWKTQGTHVEDWRADLSLGAVEQDGTLYLSLFGDWKWSGIIKFDRPRHKDYFHLPFDYPRINQFPEWFTVSADKTYSVRIGDKEAETQKGSGLLKGIPVSIEANSPLHISVKEQ